MSELLSQIRGSVALLTDRIHKDLGILLNLVRLLILGVCYFMGFKLNSILIEQVYCSTNEMIGGVTYWKILDAWFLFRCWRL